MKINYLFNPFTKIAGYKSLFFGIIIILLTSVVGYFSHTHFPGVLDVKIGPEFSVEYYIIQGFMIWITVSILFYLSAILFSKSKVRIVDVFGTQALARFPYFIAAFMGFSGSVETFGKYLMFDLMGQGEPVELPVFTVIIAVFIILLTLILTIWMVTLMFNAFKISANLKGPKLIVLFIVILVITMILTHLVSRQLIFTFI